MATAIAKAAPAMAIAPATSAFATSAFATATFATATFATAAFATAATFAIGNWRKEIVSRGSIGGIIKGARGRILLACSRLVGLGPDLLRCFWFWLEGVRGRILLHCGIAGAEGARGRILLAGAS